ncbi:DUF5658 family protein [Bacillus sp. FJAT-29937]|uniref:DUF5658 family protein n=1 Tax=Bacillus sp. FJAT-29937 TaxID=1720553 RepID=UPI00083587B8|nr:DUF5658 family protein [Bacillus sp. FJAT-29937]
MKINFKKIFFYLALLNLFDGIVTFIGIQFSLIEEMNPIMNALYQTNPFYFLGFKVILSAALCIFLFIKKLPGKKMVNNLALAATGLYTIVFVIHAIWIITLI